MQNETHKKNRFLKQYNYEKCKKCGFSSATANKTGCHCESKDTNDFVNANQCLARDLKVAACFHCAC